MKKLIFISLIFLFATCDKIDFPIPIEEGKVDSSLCPEPTFSPNTYTKRNVLVEDFTGHKCTFCPNAAYSIDTLKANIGKQVIPVGIHVTDNFAGVSSSDAPKYQTDFRTSGGTDIFNQFPPVGGLPAVMLNRKGGFTSTPGRLNVYLSSLPSNLRTFLSDVPKVKLQTISTFDNTTKRVCAYAEVEIMDNLTEDHSIVFLLLEDSIVDWQKYNGSGGDPVYGNSSSIQNYVHKHVLRKVMNGWQGKKIITGGGTTTGDKIIEGTTFEVTNADWNTNHLEIVAYVYNNTTKEIIQAASEKL